jgi:hypothetical protein
MLRFKLLKKCKIAGTGWKGVNRSLTLFEFLNGMFPTKVSDCCAFSTLLLSL